MKTLFMLLLFTSVLSGCLPKKTTNKAATSDSTSNTSGGTTGGSGSNGTNTCTTDYNPVCGSDGVDYSNPCLANLAGVSSFTQGTCSTSTGAGVGHGSTTGSIGTNCFGPGTGTQILDYYILNIIDGGVGNTNAPAWISTNDIQASNASPSILVTDSRMNIRVIAKPAPFPDNQRCHFQQNYSKLTFKIGIKSPGSTNYVDTIQFNELDASDGLKCSQVMGFRNIPQNSPSSPLIMEIFDTRWDGDCLLNGGLGGSCDSPTFIWGGNGINACWNIELQISTDDTKDLPN